MGDIKIPVTIPYDENGMLGRECLECKRYFKLKPGTGLPTDHVHCPYCEYEGKNDTFWTQAQLEYAKSVVFNQAFNQIIKPSLDKLNKSFKDLERSTRNNLIQIRVTTPTINNSFPIKYYSEEELETNLTCDNCGLVFSVYGVFARCPDCSETNAFLIYDKSIEATEKQLGVISKPEVPIEMQEQYIGFVLSSCISAFDALGKELRRKRSELYPEKPRNLFQNITALNEHLNKLISNQLLDYDQLFKMFQVRHIIEHNMGVVDDGFVKKIPSCRHLLGRKYPLTPDELSRFLVQMKELGLIIRNHFKKVE